MMRSAFLPAGALSALAALMTATAAVAGTPHIVPSTTAVESAYRTTDGSIAPKPGVRHVRHARKHAPRHRYAATCGVFEPHPNGYCPNYTGPIYHRVGISYAWVEDYAEVPAGSHRAAAMVPRYDPAGISYGWPPYHTLWRGHPTRRHHHHHAWR